MATKEEIERARATLPDYVSALTGIPVSDLMAGREFRCLCPDHDDEHPSMHLRLTGNGTWKATCLAAVHVGPKSKGGIFDGDAIDIVEMVEGTGFTESVDYLNHHFGQGVRTVPMRRAEPTPEPPCDITRDVLAAHDALVSQASVGAREAVRYLREERALGESTVKGATLGWVTHPSDIYPHAKVAAAKLGWLVLPFEHEDTFTSAVFRPLGQTSYRYKEYKPRGIRSKVWNEDALAGDVFVCEGIFDALALRAMLRVTGDAGSDVCALCGTSNVHLLCEAVRDLDERPRVTCVMDNDKAGLRATQELVLSLHPLCDTRVFCGIPSHHKDADDYRVAIARGEEPRWRDLFERALSMPMTPCAPDFEVSATKKLK